MIRLRVTFEFGKVTPEEQVREVDMSPSQVESTEYYDERAVGFRPDRHYDDPGDKLTQQPRMSLGQYI